MFLATTSLVDFWREDDDLIYLSHGCLFPSNPDLWQKEKHKIIEAPWRDKKVLQNAILYTEALTESYLISFSEILNSYYGTQHSLRYWKILFGQWLSVYISQLYDRYITVIKGIDKRTNFYTILLEKQCQPIKIKNTQHEVSLNALNIYSDIFRSLGFKFEEQQIPEWLMPKTTKEKKANSPLFDLSSILNVKAQFIAGWLAYDTRKIKALLKATGVPFDIIGYYDFDEILSIFDFKPEHTVRRQIASLKTNNHFELLLLNKLALDFPTELIEGYIYYNTLITENFKILPKYLISALGCQENIVFKYLAAHATEKGSKLLLTQHGSMYGTYEHVPSMKFEIDISDKFFTWGWAPPNDPKCKNLPALTNSYNYLTSNYPNQPSDMSRILYLTNQFVPYFTDFRSAIKCFGSSQYFEWQLNFLQNIPIALQKEISYRCKASNHENIFSYLNHYFPDITIESRSDKPLIERLNESKIAVCDCNTQVYIDALQNLPTILFWDKNIWRANSVAETYFDKLRDVGVLWDSPIDAAKHLIDIYQDPYEWWLRSDVQTAVKLFLKNFYLHSHSWKSMWVESISNIID